MEHVKYLVIGNGIAGHAAVKQIRKNDPDGSILIIGNEGVNTYYRIKITSLLADDKKDFDIQVSDDKWYEENRVETKTSVNAVKLDVENKKVLLANDEELGYEKLLIATGGKAFVPPIEGKSNLGCFTLRDLRDLKDIHKYLKDKEKVAVLGGGLLGLEAAYSLKELGKDVTIINSSSYLLNHQLDEEIGKRLNEAMEALGFKVYVNTSITKINGSDRVESINLGTGETIPMDMVLFSTGVRPVLDLVEGTGVQVNRAIVVNESMETNLPGIYAAGDCVEFNGKTVGLWTSSNEQGKVAGAAMTGEKIPYEAPKLFTTLQIGNINIFSAGNVAEYDQVYRYEDAKEGVLNKIFVTKGVISGVILTGNIREMHQMVKRIAKHENIEDYLRVSLPYKLEG